MKTRSKVHLSLIADETSRRATFRKRKIGMMKKLNELVTLCDIKACAVVYTPYESNPEIWPSKDGVEEVVSKFLEVPTVERRKKMADQEAYTWERIKKGREQVKRLRDENRESELREFMFDCLEGKMMEYHYDARHIQDLRSFIDNYLNQLTRRIEMLTESGESSSSSFPPLFGDVISSDVVDAAAVTAPIGVYDHIQYQNMNQQEPVQYQTPEHMQYQNMNSNQPEPVQYQSHADFCDQIHHGDFDMNSKQTLNLDLIHNLSLNLNQYPCPNHQQSFMDILMGQPQQMSYLGERATMSFMDDNHNHQQPTVDLTITDHMSSITATATTDVFGPNINMSRW